MSSSAPTTHLVDALEMQGDALIDLFEIRLKTAPVVYRFWNGATRTWLGNTYEGLACKLEGENVTAEGQVARPSLTVVNTDNIFGTFASEGYFDLAEVTRKRVLQAHFIGNVSEWQQRIWICARPSLVTWQVMQLELRSPIDMPAWKTPARTYSPPEFPFVSI